jgi:rubredoxin
MELNHLRDEGFLDTNHIFLTTPGLHEDVRELERQLLARIQTAKEKADRVLVLYGGKFCYVNAREPTRTMRTIIEESGPGVRRIEATHCMDMIASQDERERISKEMAGGEKVWWMVPGWIQFRHDVFSGWDKGLANENFPRHTGGAIVLDAIGYVDRYMAEKPEEFLEYSDWMGIPIQGYAVTLDRFQSLLLEQARQLKNKIAPNFSHGRGDPMQNDPKKWACAHCGYTSTGQFVGDICPQCGLTYWKCSHCGYTITAPQPPDTCPECGEKCQFVNITCYTPECGGPGNIDPRL